MNIPYQIAKPNTNRFKKSIKGKNNIKGMDLIYTLKLQISIHESLMFYKTQNLNSYSMARQTSICKVGKRNLRQLHGASKQRKIKNYKEEERELPNSECLFNEKCLGSATSFSTPFFSITCK